MELLNDVFTAKAIFIGIVFAITLGVAAYSTYFERKIAAFMQDRIGPDRAGPFGILQPLADAVKMFMKEEISHRLMKMHSKILPQSKQLF